jgi:type IV pilus assembly protein PilY1
LDGNQVFINGSEVANTLSDVSTAINTKDGWYLDFANNYARNISPPSLYSTSLLFTVFTPNSDLCSDRLGSTSLYQREFFNGLSPIYSAAIDVTRTIDSGDELGEAIPPTILLGENYYDTPTKDGVVQSNEGELKDIDLGAPKLDDRRESWRELLKDW